MTRYQRDWEEIKSFQVAQLEIAKEYARPLLTKQQFNAWFDIEQNTATMEDVDRHLELRRQAYLILMVELNGLSTRATSIAMNNFMYRKRDVRKAFEIGVLQKFRNCGDLTMREFAEWLGERLPPKPVRVCPHCGKPIGSQIKTDCC